ncbi:MAG: SAM-dependent methyltransferase [Nocardiopsaceae bacterium]|nr:SAM-dependent methyltransferase [Nocardiopsaceae bacterium]
MTVEPGWIPPETDITKANIARVYDYWLGGDHNFQADREAAHTILALDPNFRTAVRANRAFLGRAVRFLANQAGIRQFLDIGSGIPTENNVHEVAQGIVPASRVVYVDNDDVAVAHSRLMLNANPDATVIQADLREPGKILADPGTQLLLDFSKPIALLLVAVLHFVPDDDRAADILATLRGALSPGSYLVICHNCRDGQPDLSTSFENVYNSRVTAQLRFRTRDEIARLCDGFTILDPGLVWLPQWRPDSPDDVPADPEKY